jgi:hypothetical protein
MRHIHLQSDASLAWNPRHRHPLGCLISIGAQLKNGLNTWYSVVEATEIQMLCPLSMLPIRLTCIPHALPMVVLSVNPLAAWRVRSSETRRTLSTCYTGISFCMCQHPRGELSGHRTYLETKWGLASLYPCIVAGVPNVFTVLEMGVGPNEIVVRYNQWSTTLTLHDK